MFDSPKAGVRFDDSPGKKGSHGTMHKNVVWKAAGYMVKGDYHNITGNLGMVQIQLLIFEFSGMIVSHDLPRHI